MWNAADPEDEVLAMVVRTGINSTVGAMIKQIVAPSRMQRPDPFLQVSPPWSRVTTFLPLLYAEQSLKATSANGRHELVGQTLKVRLCSNRLLARGSAVLADDVC